MTLLQGRRMHALVLLLVLQLQLLLAGQVAVVEGNVFGGTIAKLNYDRVSVKNRPSDVGSADLIEGGSRLQAGVITSTGVMQNEGISVKKDLVLLFHVSITLVNPSLP